MVVFQPFNFVYKLIELLTLVAQKECERIREGERQGEKQRNNCTDDSFRIKH